MKKQTKQALLDADKGESVCMMYTVCVVIPFSCKIINAVGTSCVAFMYLSAIKDSLPRSSLSLCSLVSGYVPPHSSNT
jgi:hypothetical protein